MKKQILLFFFILSVLSFSAEKKSTFITLTTEHGLTSNTINSIYQDSKGFVWIGTADGLNRFDGIDILSFDDFKNKSIIKLTEPDSTQLYVLAENDLYRFDRKRRKTTPIIIDNKKDLFFKSFSLDKSGNLYIVSLNGFFILSSNSENCTKVSPQNVFDSYKFTDIFIDNDDVCWLTSAKGLVRYELTSKKINIYKNDIDNNLLCLIKKDEKIYIGTSNSTIISFDTQSNKFTTISSLETPTIQAITVKGNNLYVGTNGNGLKIIDLSNKKALNAIDNLSNQNNSTNLNAVYSILATDKSFWVGTFSGGISYKPYFHGIFDIHPIGSNDSKILSPNIRSFVVDKNGEGIFGTRNGLIYNSKNQIQHYTTENSTELKSNIILCIYPYNDKEYLIGTYSGGLYLLNKQSNQLKKFRDENIFRDNSVYAVLQDKQDDKTLWFATLSGLIKYNTENYSFKVFNTSNSDIVSNDIYHIKQDSSNRIWIATRNGVCYIDNDKIVKPIVPNLPTIGIVRYIYEDSKRNIWLGCENQGAFRITHDLSSFKQYTSQNILPANYVSSIIEDNIGRIWMTTTKGVVAYTDESRYAIYSLSEGLPSYAFNDGAVQITQDGTIWWGNEKGLVSLNTTNSEDLIPSRINLTKITIEGFNESARLNNLEFAPEYLNTIKIPSSEKNLIFRFSDLLYDYPSSTVYEYKLEGVNKDVWQKILTGKDITISDIPSGNHILKIRKAGDSSIIKEIMIIKERSYTILYLSLFIIITIAIFILLYKRLIFRSKKNQHNNIEVEKEKVDKVKYQNLKLEEDELNEIKKAITSFLENEKPYLNPNFKLEDMAIATNYSKIKLSQVLNIHLNTNFSNFVSTYRIEAFKEKAKEGFLQQYTLSALAKECGFSSRSSFFHTMKKLTGQTPTEFLREAGITIDKL